MSDNNANTDAGKSGGSGMIKNILIVVMAPLAILGGFQIPSYVTAVKQEVQSGTSWKDLSEKFKKGGLDSVKDMLKEAPEITSGLILDKMAQKEEAFSNAARAGVLRNMKSGAISKLEGRDLIQKLDEYDKARKK